MAHGLSELGPPFLGERIVLPIESLIAKLDAARHETAFLELFECRVDRPGLGTPVSGEPLLQFPDHLVPVHRLLRQEQEQPKRHGSNLHASRCGVPKVRGSRRWPSGSGRTQKTISRTCDSSSPHMTRSTPTADSRSKGKPSWSMRPDEPPVARLHRSSRACKGGRFRSRCGSSWIFSALHRPYV